MKKKGVGVEYLDFYLGNIEDVVRVSDRGVYRPTVGRFLPWVGGGSAVFSCSPLAPNPQKT